MRKILFVAVFAGLVMAAGCGRRTDRMEQAREDYARSLGDSIEVIKQEIDSCNQEIGTLRDRIAVMTTDFVTVANPREVGSYTLPASFAKRYPPKATALVARIDDNGQFELIATLSGRAFDCITVQGPSVSASTDVVPKDQALNYQTPELTTVRFSGAAADSVGMLVADNELNPLTVIYEQGKAVNAWKMSGEFANEIAQTYRLYKAQRELNRLERRVPMLHEKVNLLRLHLEK